jgi:putative phosphoesterase
VERKTFPSAGSQSRSEGLSVSDTPCRTPGVSWLYAMTRVAIISDVHADVHALQDFFVQIEALGCERIVCAGDLVDYGLFPEQTIALMRDRAVPCVRGNHDRWAVSHQGVSWDLSPAALAYLDGLPPELRLSVDGVRFLVVHARPGSDMDGIYEDEPSSTVLDGWFGDYRMDVLVVGHTHASLVRHCSGGRLVVNPGTLMRESKDGNARAMVFDRESGGFLMKRAVIGSFGVYDTATRRFEVQSIDRGAAGH